MSDISLSKAVRSNLLSLQNTADMMATTQNRLATGNKVNSALDNPTNFFTASSLNSRAGDINALMDGMANGIQTIEAADNGLTAITKTLESMQSTLRQARQDKSFETASFAVDSELTTGTISFGGGAVGETPVEIELTKGSSGTAEVTAAPLADTTLGTLAGADTIAFDVTVDGAAAPQSIEITAEDVAAVGNGDGSIDDVNEFASILNSKLEGVTVSVSDTNELTFTSDATGVASNVEIGQATVGAADGATTVTAATLGLGADITGTAGEATGGDAKTTDELVREINNNRDLEGKIRASNDNGQLRIENLSTQELNVDGVSSSGNIDGSSNDQATIGGNSVRADLASQYNELRDQLDKLADDASFNGINLLRGDKLTITFNETDTSSLEIQSRIPNEEGEAESGLSINSASLGIKTNMEESDLDSDDTIDSMLADIKTAVNTVRSQSSAFGSSLSIVENRQNFSKNMINTLETGAGNLTLADSNQEAANLLALQTRQQLSSTALSMASQQDQAVLRLF